MKVLNHRFRLKSTEPTKPGGILYMCSINNRIFQYGVGYTITPELWDMGTKRPITNKERIKEYKKEIPEIKTQLTNITRRIDNICHGVETFIQLCQKQEEGIDLNQLAAYLDKNVKGSARTINDRPKLIKKTENNKSTIDLTLISEYAKKFLIDIENGHRTIQAGSNSQKKYSQGTVKNYKGFLSQWIAFESKQPKKYKWEDLSRELYNQFLQFLYKGEYLANSAGRHIKHWKVIAQAAFDDQIHVNKAFRESYFKTISSKVDNIYLTEEEVQKLELIDLSNRPAWEKARDLFLMGCYTAQRYGDVKQFSPDHINGNYINIIQQKTKTSVKIPISKRMMKLFKKYNFSAPKLPEQKVNEYIKEIANLARIDTPIHKKETIGGRDILSIHPKYYLITTHTARRTAITQMDDQQMPYKEIMAISGHTTITSFEKYLCMGTEEKAKRAADHKFFK
ncbi:MAG: site-specific integrase [Saprospiraceae bacterium]